MKPKEGVTFSDIVKAMKEKVETGNIEIDRLEKTKNGSVRIVTRGGGGRRQKSVQETLREQDG